MVGVGVAVVVVTGCTAVAGAADSTESEDIASDEDWFPKQKAATGWTIGASLNRGVDAVEERDDSTAWLDKKDSF
ncbi:hypothetical protein V8F20_008441 [Naviculisporaceae sp. PSN 640]